MFWLRLKGLLKQSLVIPTPDFWFYSNTRNTGLMTQPVWIPVVNDYDKAISFEKKNLPSNRLFQNKAINELIPRQKCYHFAIDFLNAFPVVLKLLILIEIAYKLDPIGPK